MLVFGIRSLFRYTRTIVGLLLCDQQGQQRILQACYSLLCFWYQETRATMRKGNVVLMLQECDRLSLWWWLRWVAGLRRIGIAVCTKMHLLQPQWCGMSSFESAVESISTCSYCASHRSRTNQYATLGDLWAIEGALISHVFSVLTFIYNRHFIQFIRLIMLQLNRCC